jgi:hypothetical protein
LGEENETVYPRTVVADIDIRIKVSLDAWRWAGQATEDGREMPAA